MKVLVACEESGRVTAELLKLGVDAYSCDLLPTSGDYPDRHIRGDVIPLLEQDWDMVIAFPPCTYLTITGNRWFNEDVYGEKARMRKKFREDAVRFFLMFATCKCPRVAIENPVGIMSSVYRKPDQIIQPYYFGDPFEKRTCLWLKGLPKLIPTNIVEIPSRVKFASGRTMPKWYADMWGNKEERAKLRSKTFPGIAKAMAEQWTKGDL